MIRAVCGFAPYEQQAMELLTVSKDEWALKFIKKRYTKSSSYKPFPRPGKPSGYQCFRDRYQQSKGSTTRDIPAAKYSMVSYAQKECMGLIQ
ncbi:hypothetical protein MG293_018708 [Ovis ammon polii]|uniref:Large ribosomal subunit protein eL36 n=2 Tax=Ovis TaxID=9935 RepID=A0A835ZTV7_SHEEP|nr:hypothetical protein JEQ12_010750 [Ovis aries]KAI4530850.1 hypothetical protein MG293_018708 [Ovis ammon polii]KAI4552629.1 hypothetical protein MJT46_017280 [Ovis ammon polii x Ovis aries]